ncbi:MAG: dynamin family protein, partial [Proteobacteria bacterium]|nr:dynamin family protein [Pseudomonadota bacterium]
MTNKTSPINSIEKIIDDALSIFQLVEDVPQLKDHSFNGYKESIRRIPGHISEGQLKIAVVGVIKSGKSTFVNSLLGKELVKRGAGVITSITTRIRKGKKNQATFYFKSWDEINSQLQNALLLFPHDGSDNKMLSDFDIRRKNDRNYLKKAYKKLIHDFSGAKAEIRPETLLIKHALCGFDTCKDLVQADENVICFSSKEFDKHKDYTSDPNIAFYIKDVCLDVFGKTMDPNVEIADCQGADSTDPAQLAQVLTYLESSNLIIYCVSSRIGLRQSDITFLKQIKNLGLIENIIFINNCDLTEHENLDDLIKIETSIKETLEFLEIHPRIFSFSSLYNLFLNLESKLNKKDKNRLKFWQEEKKIVQYCDLKTQEFNSFFKQIMDKNGHGLLISNHLKRLDIIMGQLDQRTNIFLGLLSSDKSKEERARQTLNNLHHNASRLEAIVENSLDGAVSGLKEEIESNLKNAFIHDDKGILKKARDYIRTTFLDVEKYKSVTEESGFKQILYLMFQDFKRGLDLYVIEEVKPELKRFVQSQEEKIFSYFQSLFDSYQIDLLKADHYSQFETEPKLAHQQRDFIYSVDIEKIKKILGLQLPAVIFEAKYTSMIKTNVLTDFGLHTVSQILFSLFNSKSNFSFSPGLKKAAKKIKKENQKIIKDQFEQYHMNLRANYFLPLIEAATRDFKEKINERFNQYQYFKEEMEHLFSLKHSEKKEQKK